jgi:hypothetical protein
VPPALSPLAAELLRATVDRSTCPGCPIPDTFYAAAAARPYQRLLSVPSGTPAACRRRCAPPPQPRRWPPLSPVARAPCTTPPVRPMSPPPSPRSGFNLTAEQRPATAISRIQGTSTPSLNFQPNFSVLPPKETSRHSFDSPSSPLGTEAYQLTPGNVGNIASKSDTTQETQTHPPS